MNLSKLNFYKSIDFLQICGLIRSTVNKNKNLAKLINHFIVDIAQNNQVFYNFYIEHHRRYKFTVAAIEVDIFLCV